MTVPESVVMFATSTGSPHSASTSQLLIEDNMAAIPLSWYSGWADPSIGKNLFEVQTNYCIEAMNGNDLHGRDLRSERGHRHLPR